MTDSGAGSGCVICGSPIPRYVVKGRLVCPAAVCIAQAGGLFTPPPPRTRPATHVDRGTPAGGRQRREREATQLSHCAVCGQLRRACECGYEGWRAVAALEAVLLARRRRESSEELARPVPEPSAWRGRWPTTGQLRTGEEAPLHCSVGQPPIPPATGDLADHGLYGSHLVPVLKAWELGGTDVLNGSLGPITGPWELPPSGTVVRELVEQYGTSLWL